MTQDLAYRCACGVTLYPSLAYDLNRLKAAFCLCNPPAQQEEKQS